MEKTDSEIEKLFRYCDRQGKGYLTKEDILVLHDELSLSENQLEEIFTKLDRNKMGFVTLPNFIIAYNNHIHLMDSCGYIIHENISNRYSSQLEYLLSKLPRSADSLTLMNELLCYEGTENLQKYWLKVLKNLTEDVNNGEQYAHENIKHKINRIQKDYAILLDELEQDIEKEKKQVLFQERKHLSRIKERYEYQLVIKEKQLSDMAEHTNELLGRLAQILRKKNAHKRSKADLQKEKAELAEEVEKQKDIISQLERQFETFRQEMLKECKRCYKNGYESGRKRAKIEEDGLLEELKMLQEIYRILNNSDEQENNTNGFEELLMTATQQS